MVERVDSMARIDMVLVEKGFFETRSKAQFAIQTGTVYCNGQQVTKNGLIVNNTDILEVRENTLPYVSKGGLKLEKALIEFSIDLTNKNMIDIGASTGGFTDCAIQHGVGHVLAIDVGSLQFSKKLLETKHVTLMENTDFRNVENSLLKGYSLATIDVSFISVEKLLPKLAELEDLYEIILLIKPQFECGVELAKQYHGVVLSKKVHVEIIENVIKNFNRINFYLNNLTYSPIRGGSGNIEYLAYFKKNGINKSIHIDAVVKQAFSILRK